MLSPLSNRVMMVRKRKNPPAGEKTDAENRYRIMWKDILDDVCDQCSLHGLNHIIREDRSAGEKAFWTATVACAVLLAAHAITESWKSYNESTIDTVVETTFYNYADIAFPMVVVCDSSRVDWQRVTRLTARDIPGVDPDLLPAVKKVLKTFSVLSYGDFDELDELRNMTELARLKTLNITELLAKVMRPCGEVFSYGDCWWNFKPVNCCDIFELQRTEFGLCHSFNSDFSEYSRGLLGGNSEMFSEFWRTESGEIRPRRTGDKGQWSGVRMYVSTMKPEQVAPGIIAKPSIQLMVGDPKGAPLGSDIVVMAGSFGNIHVWGDRIYNTNRTKQLDPIKRRCYFPEEQSTGMGTNYYLRRNCKSACYMNHVVQHCGCYLEFMFALQMKRNFSLRPCNMEDLVCLSKKNSYFNNFLPSDGISSVFFTNEPPGLMCDCMPDCIHQMYISELVISEPIISSSNLNYSSTAVLIDLHFRQSTCILYRSDLVFGWLELLVSFGGCAGLFLGSSLLSFIEVIYFLTWRVYYHWRKTSKTVPRAIMEMQCKNTTTESVSKNSQTFIV